MSAVQSGPVLTFALTEWEAFIRRVRDGEFDLRWYRRPIQELLIVVLLSARCVLALILVNTTLQRGGEVMAATAEAIEGATSQGESSDTTAPKGSGGPASHGGRRGGSSLERVTVNLTPRASDALEQLARITGESKTDTVNKALQLFAYLQQLQHDNGAIYVREAGSKEPERLKIF